MNNACVVAAISLLAAASAATADFGDGDTTKTGFSFGVGGDVKLTRRLVP